MKIAIVTPHPVPFALGGAENLWWGLQDHFQRHTEHDCDIVALLSPEGSFWDLVSSYETFSKLDLSAYDCVISGKYPAWMVDHPNHICYMLHRLRGLYDTYAPGNHDSSVLKLPKLQSLMEWMEDSGGYPSADQVPELFDKLRALREAELPENAFAFPGPFSRAVVHFLDNAALSSQRIRRYAAIADTVRHRKSYFPPEAEVDVLHPPPHRHDYREGESRYLFTSSRLDRPKRVDLLVEAMKHVPEDIPLLIAGTGPDEARLKQIAGDDPRIRFLGFVPDDEMPALYADALAVPFVPYDEDYGLVTIEAMKSGKPVLTFSDSGGPCEFVRDGETGFVTPPSAEALGARLSQLARDPDLARAMGQNAKTRVESVNWHHVAEGLLEQAPAKPAHARPAMRPKLTVATTFRVFPPMNGGQARVYHLYKNLAETFDIDIVSLGIATDARSEKEIAPGLVEIHVPKSEAHAKAERDMADLVDHVPIGDIAAHTLIGLTPAFDEALEISAMTSDAVIACHPYLIEALRRAAPDKPLWYEAQDVEMTLKSAMFTGKPAALPLLSEVGTAERACWISAERVFACAQRDLDELASIYGPTRAHLYEVPNGFALDEIPYTDLAERRRLRSRVGLDGQTAIFMGSWHGPNLEAIEDILKAAETAPRTRFIVMGSACTPFKDRARPSNVHLLGQVDDDIRNGLLAAADVALNPMHSGSGTNLKILDYFAAGVPVISTRFGARGLTIEPDRDFIAIDDGFAAALDKLEKLGEAKLSDMIVSARRLVEDHYSWKVIAERFIDKLTQTGLSLTRG